MANTTDALTFVAWSEEAEGMNCWTCDKENAEDYCEGEDNICKSCASKWIYYPVIRRKYTSARRSSGVGSEDKYMAIYGSKGEGYYLISDEEEKEEYDPRFNSHEAFNEWITDELDLHDLLNDDVVEWELKIKKWCDENHHEIREDGVYNMNDDEEEESETESELAEKYERWEEEEEEDLKEDLKARRLERLKKELEWGLKD